MNIENNSNSKNNEVICKIFNDKLNGYTTTWPKELNINNLFHISLTLNRKNYLKILEKRGLRTVLLQYDTVNNNWIPASIKHFVKITSYTLTNDIYNDKGEINFSLKFHSISTKIVTNSSKYSMFIYLPRKDQTSQNIEIIYESEVFTISSSNPMDELTHKIQSQLASKIVPDLNKNNNQSFDEFFDEIGLNQESGLGKIYFNKNNSSKKNEKSKSSLKGSINKETTKAVTDNQDYSNNTNKTKKEQLELSVIKNKYRKI